MSHIGQIQLIDPSKITDTNNLYDYIELLVDALEGAETELKKRGQPRATLEPVLVNVPFVSV